MTKIDELINALKTNDMDIRRSAYEKLAKIGKRATVHIVRAFIEHRLNSNQLIRILGEVDIVFFPTAEKRRYQRLIVDAIARIGRPMIPALVDALENYAQTRFYACAVMALMEIEGSISPTVVELLFNRTSSGLSNNIVITLRDIIIRCESVAKLDELKMLIREKSELVNDCPEPELVKKLCIGLLATLNVRKNDLLSSQIDIRLDKTFRPSKEKPGRAQRMRIARVTL